MMLRMKRLVVWHAGHILKLALQNAENGSQLLGLPLQSSTFFVACGVSENNFNLHGGRAMQDSEQKQLARVFGGGAEGV